LNETDVRMENDRLIRSGYEAFGRGDLAAVEAVFRPDATWHAQALGVLSGDHVGWPAIAAFFGRTMELTQGTFTVSIEDVLTNETGAAVVVRSRGARDGTELDSRQVHLFRLADGRVAEAWQFAPSDADAFWSESV
jgi:ketosteroid isomerase-like protein